MLQSLGVLLQGLAPQAAGSREAPPTKIERHRGPAPNIAVYRQNLPYIQERVLPEGSAWRLNAVQVSPSQSSAWSIFGNLDE
jgi:hypothetical protein